jgi:hypothetical protein
MKRVDKPTNSQCGNLLNIKKTSPVQAKVLPKGKLFKSLTSKTDFLCLYVSKLISLASNQVHVHLKPVTQITDKGEDI